MIRQMTTSDLDEIVNLHLQYLPFTTSSKIGFTYVKSLYRLLLLNPKNHLAYVYTHESHIHGVITLTLNLEKSIKFLSPLTHPIMLFEIVKAILSGRVSPFMVYKRYMVEKKLIKASSPYVSILSLFIRENLRRQGIGKKLLSFALKGLKSANVNCLYVDTMDSNQKAQKFYLSQKFIYQKSINNSKVYKLTINNK